VNTFQMRSVVLAVGLLGGALCSARAQSSAPPSTTPTAGANDAAAAEQAIRASAEQFVAAFNRGDAKALAALWTADGDYVDDAGELTTGRAAIEAKYAAYFAAEPDAKIEISVDAVRLVGADAAIEDGTAAVTAASQAAPVTGRYTVVHAKREGKWQMASVREFPAPASDAGDPLEDLAWMVGAWRAEHLGVEFEIDCRWLPNNSFVEATYSRIEGEVKTPTATQIIGVNPGTGRLMSWMFNGNGGVATGDWTPSDAGWEIDYEGLTNDGVPSTAVNWLFRVNDALVWQSTNRQLAGEPLPDTEEVVLKRK
jgi:uncharacterized protein (TIGR02246 family)